MIEGMSVPPPLFKPVGDAALLVSFEQRIDEQINRRVHALASSLLREPIPGLGEAVPAYSSVLVHYDPLRISLSEVIQHINQLAYAPQADNLAARKLVEIPTVYGGSRGPDLEGLARKRALSVDEVIALHSRVEYQVYLIGFTPGFAYLGSVDERIASPRLETPRLSVKAGSVGIAGRQTGVYPVDSPGGWQIIGWTPVRLFDPQRTPPSLLEPGDRVRFVPISEKELANGFTGT